MGIVLIVIAFLLSTGIVRLRRQQSFFLAVPESLLLLSVFVALSSEILSAFHALTYGSLLVTWAAADGIGAVLLLMTAKQQGTNLSDLLTLNKKSAEVKSVAVTGILMLFFLPFIATNQHVIELLSLCVAYLLWCVRVYILNKPKVAEDNTSLAAFIRANWLISVGALALLVMLFFQGVSFAPNNWDSMTYHLGRVLHWVSNNSIEPYPTGIYRQLWQPPLAELWILHVCLLQGSDLLAFVVQFVFFVGSAFALVGIAQQLKLSLRSQAMVLLFAMCIPEVVLQASSTQNDIVAAFFVLMVANYCLRTLVKSTLIDYCLLGLSAGCALYTKGTSYVFLLPIFGLWFIVMLKRVSKTKQWRDLAFVPASIILLFAMNAGYYSRNMAVSGSPLGAADVKLFNERFGPSALIINVAKNLGLHFGTNTTARTAVSWLESLHQMLDEKPNDKTINYEGMQFSLTLWNHHEDNASNVGHVVLMFLAGVVLAVRWKKSSSVSKWTYLFCVAEFFVFSFLLKWQPWHTRLHVAIFLMTSIPLASIFIDDWKSKRVALTLSLALAVFIVPYAVRVVILNPVRPLTTSPLVYKVKLKDDRYTKLCALRPEIQQQCIIVRDFLRAHADSTAFSFTEDTWEYPLYDNVFTPNFRAVPAINVSNHSKNAPGYESRGPESLQYIVASGKTDSIAYKGVIYRAQTRMPEYSILTR